MCIYNKIHYIPFDLDLGVKVKGHIINFIVNVSPLKPLDVATSNYARAYPHNVKETGLNFV